MSSKRATGSVLEETSFLPSVLSPSRSSTHMMWCSGVIGWGTEPILTRTFPSLFSITGTCFSWASPPVCGSPFVWTISNSDFAAPQIGHFQSSGRVSKATLLFAAGSYTYPQTLHLNFCMR